MKHEDQNIRTFSTYSDHRASSVWFIFNFCVCGTSSWNYRRRRRRRNNNNDDDNNEEVEEEVNKDENQNLVLFMFR